MRFTSPPSCYRVSILTLALFASVKAQTDSCQICINDLASSIPQCKGVDVEKSVRKAFIELSSGEQSCICDLAPPLIDTPLLKCIPMCFGPPTAALKDLTDYWIANCKTYGSGPHLSQNSSSTSSMPSSRLVSAAAAMVLSVVSLA